MTTFAWVVVGVVAAADGLIAWFTFRSERPKVRSIFGPSWFDDQGRDRL